MPTYKGLITEEQILQLISYMRTLTPVVTSNTPNKAVTTAPTATTTTNTVPNATAPTATPAPKATGDQKPKTENNSSGSPAKTEPAKK